MYRGGDAGAGVQDEGRRWGGDEGGGVTMETPGLAGARRITRLCIFCLLSTSGGLCVCNVAAQEFKLPSYQSLLF